MPATTFTTRLGLRKPDPDPTTGDFISVVTDINQSMDKLDAAVGFTICTSGTRPTGSDRWDGRQIYETDTRRSYFWSAALAIWVPLVNARAAGGPYLFGLASDTTGEGINLQGSGVGVSVIRSRVAADTQARYSLEADGDQGWSSGAASFDTFLGRSTTATLKVDDHLVVDGSLTVGLLGNTANAGNLMVKLQETVVGTPQSTVTLNPIPTGFRSIKIVVDVRVTAAVINSLVALRFNNDSTNNYNYQQVGGFGSTVTALASTAQNSMVIGDAPGSSNTVGKAASLEILVVNHTGTAFTKKAISQEYMISDNQFAKIWGGYWNSTSAITRIDFLATSGNLETGTVVTFYGIP